MVFNKGLISLLKAGLPIIDALESLRSKSLALDGVIKDTVEGVRGGKSLSDAMEARSDAFSTLYIASVRAGEKDGRPRAVHKLIRRIPEEDGGTPEEGRVLADLSGDTYAGEFMRHNISHVLRDSDLFADIHLEQTGTAPREQASHRIFGFRKRYALVFLPLAAVVAFGCRAYLRTSIAADGGLTG